MEIIEVSSMYYKTRKKSSDYNLLDLKFDTILKTSLIFQHWGNMMP